MSPLLIVAVVVFLIFIFIGVQKRKKVRLRAAFIETYIFPQRLQQQLKVKYPHLTDDQCDRVIDGLREYFQLNLMARKQMVAMPSQVVDIAWHEFILFTRHYDAFCKQGLGRFLHHTPAEAMQSPTQAQEGIKQAWKLSCRRENIDPKKPTRLPLLFALDAELSITDGFKYELDCKGLKDQGYCASHIGCGGGCGGDSDGCGGGCGGD